jgi:hypothetical protein
LKHGYYLAVLPLNLEIFGISLDATLSRIDILLPVEKVARSGGNFLLICKHIAP